MKKLLLVIAAVAMLLPSCKKINEALDSLDGRLDKLEQEAIPSIDEQIAAINTTLENLDSMDKELKGYIDALTTTASNLQEQINTTNTKIDEVEAALKKELEDSNAENLAQLQTAKAEVLAQLEAAKTELENELAQINATIATLQEKDKELDEKIKDLNDYVNNELTKTTTWVEATFATLEQYNSLVTEIAVIKEQIKATNQSIAALETYLTTKINADIAAAVASLSADIQQKVKEITDAYTDAIKSAKEEITAAYTAAIQTAITTLDNSLKTWVGEQLANYYTIAQIDAMLATMEQEMNGKLEAQKAYLEGLINELSAALTKSIADNKVLIEGLQKDITTLQGTAAEHASRIAQNASTIATNTQNIIDLSKSIYANKEDITANEKAIADNKALIEANAKLIADNAAAIKALQASPDASVVKNAAKIAENAEGIAQNAALISANAVAINNNASAIANNTADILQLQQDLASAKAEITEAYKTAINDAITTNNGVIDAKIAAKVETINTRIDNEVAIINASIKTLTDRMNVLEEEMEAIQKLVADFLKEFDEIKETIERILSMIQSVSYVPQYSDGKAVMMVTAGVYDGTVEFDFQLSPKSVVSDIVANWQSILAIKAVYTKTRAVSYVDMPIISCVADGQNGILTIVASGKNLGEEFFKGNQPVNAALFISDGNSEVVSDYVEIVPVNTSGEEIIPANEIWYTSVDGEIVAPNSATAFNSVLLSNTYHGDKGILKFDADVTEIQAEAFKGCEDIVTMTLPNTVVTIGDSAFEGSKGLHSILLSESLKEIGESAFDGCISLRSINIPNGITEIKGSTFYGCKKMLSVRIPNSITSIGSSAFYGCDSISRVDIKDLSAWCKIDFYSNKSNPLRSAARLYLNNSEVSDITIQSNVIEDYAFYNCPSITSITISNSVETIGSYAFYNCSNATRLEIENGAKYIGTQAFCNCDKLVSSIVPNSVADFSTDAFNGCSGELYIDSAMIEKSYSNTYGENCWLYNTKFSKIVIGDNVKSVGNKMFYNCSTLTEIVLPNSISSIGQDAFYGCSNLISVTIPDSVTWIGQSAFSGCGGLENMVIGTGITSIDSYAFSGCTGELTVNSNIPNSIKPHYNSASYGVFYNSKFTKVVIGDNVSTIGDMAFHNCHTITDVVLGSGVSEIKDYAFSNCNNLVNLTIASSPNIGSNAFEQCSSLLNVYSNLSIWCQIGFNSPSSNPLYLGAKLYDNGQELTNHLVVPSDVTEIKDFAFYNYLSLEKVTIPNTVVTIGYSAFSNCAGELVIDSKIVETDYASGSTPTSGSYDGNWLYGAKFSNVTIGNSVEKLGNYVFYQLTSLTNIQIGDNVRSIGSSAFAQCGNLSSINIVDSITEIASEAFSGCVKLADVSFGNGLASIGNGAFVDCDSLTSIIIPENVVTIEDSAFNSCSNLENVIIGNSITSIGAGAFYYCRKLATIYIKALTPPAIGSNILGYTASGLKIYVPRNSVSKYESARYWSDYASYIEGYDF